MDFQGYRRELMKRVLLILALMVASAGHAMATFSIVAIDPATGDLGVAVASRYFAVGAVVPWVEANVGAVATQANVNVGYGPRALELLRQGLTAQQVMDKLFAEDTFPGKDGRQIAIVDSKGNIAVFTGDGAQAGRVTRRERPGQRRATFWSDLTLSKRWARLSRARTMSSRKNFTPRSKQAMKPAVTAAAAN